MAPKSRPIPASRDHREALRADGGGKTSREDQENRSSHTAACRRGWRSRRLHPLSRICPCSITSPPGQQRATPDGRERQGPQFGRGRRALISRGQGTRCSHRQLEARSQLQHAGCRVSQGQLTCSQAVASAVPCAGPYIPGRCSDAAGQRQSAAYRRHVLLRALRRLAREQQHSDRPGRAVRDPALDVGRARLFRHGRSCLGRAAEGSVQPPVRPVRRPALGSVRRLLDTNSHSSEVLPALANLPADRQGRLLVVS
jgi:hypothetical protein